MLQARLTSYTVNAVTQGPEALATTRVSLTQKGRDSDVITSAQVYTRQQRVQEAPS